MVGVFLAGSVGLYVLQIMRPGFIGAAIKGLAYLPLPYEVPINYMKGLISRPDRIVIDIKNQDFQKLAYLRQVALKKGKIVTEEGSYVRARITTNGKSVKAKIRLKGDVVNHLQGDKWSLRVKVTGNDSIFGMKRLSIQDPKRSGYIFEWILHQLYKYEGLISLRYKFVDVVINGKNMGVYALEESFSKELIENNKRREGPILKWDESHLWDGSSDNPGSAKSEADIFFCSDIDIFRANKTLSSDVLRTNYHIARQLMENFRNSKIELAEIFDVKQLATLYALTNLSCSNHALRWKNIRFYYNPITNKLEPIGYNAYSEQRWLGTLGTGYNLLWENNFVLFSTAVPQYQNLILKNEDFMSLYMKTLERMSNKAYLDRFFQHIDGDLKEKLSILYRDYPGFVFNKKDYYTNQKLIYEMLNPSIPAKLKIVRDNKSSGNENIKFLVANTGFLPIELVSLHISTSSKADIYQLGHDILQGKRPSRPIEYHELHFSKLTEIKLAENEVVKFVLVYHIIGLDRVLTCNTDSLQIGISNIPTITSDNLQVTLANNNILQVDAQNHVIKIRPGTWQLNQNLIVPCGFKVMCSEGTSLSLMNSAKIISYSPIEFIGSKHKPITINSADSTGQGLVVIKAGQESILEYVNFEYLEKPVQNGWQLTGAITFYESPVRISNCRFTDNKNGDDFLNTVRSDFEIKNSVFDSSVADAFDSDFCKGKIIESSFINCGNDAIDVSGSVITLENININGTGDKGISVGEKSSISANHITINDANIAIASKDSSKITINGIDIRNSKIGFTAFQKKSEYGPASISANELELENIDTPYLIETDSHLTVDGEMIKPIHDNVKKILYPTE